MSFYLRARNLLLSAAILVMAASTAFAGLTIRYACIVDKNQENKIPWGYAQASYPVYFVAAADCCGTINYAWAFGDGGTGNGASVNHTYDEEDAGTNTAYVTCTCTNCSQSGNSPTLGVHVIEDIRVTEIGDDTLPTDDMRLSFNDVVHVEAVAEPEDDLPAGAKGRIDWRITVGSYDLDKLNTGEADMTLPAESSWPTTAQFGSKTLKVTIDSADMPGQNDELITGPYSLLSDDKAINIFFDKTNTQNPDTGDMPNWFYYWGLDRHTACPSYKESGTTTHEGGTINWEFDDGILPGRGWTTQNSATSYTIQLSSNTPTSVNVSFKSPRYPETGTFTDSSGNPRYFEAENITLSYTRSNDWEGIDVVQKIAEHEKAHVKVYRRWEENGLWCVLYGPRSTGSGGNDKDNDWLPNAFEDDFGTHWETQRTYSFYLAGTDQEVFCEHTSGDQSGAAAHDWAHDGEQWH